LRLSALSSALLVFSAQHALAGRYTFDGESPAAWLGIGMTFLICGGFIAVMVHLPRARARKIEKLALSLGLTFRGAASDADSTLPAGCYVAEIGHDRVVSNVLEAARSDDLNLILFDYQYTVGRKDKSRYFIHQTITRVQSGLFHLPAFILFPETFLAKMGKMLGRPDINFPESPEFSRKYILRGQDEAAVRALFTPALRQALESQDRRTIEGAGSLLFVFRARRRLNPKQLPARIEQDKRIAALFFEAQRAAAPEHRV
jgi:hypothetical protein